MYNIGDIFYNDEEYTKRAEYCNKNNLRIVEIEADENGRRFQIQVPKTTDKELNQIEMQKLKQQLADMDYKTSKYADGEYTQEEWTEIVVERKAIRERVRELERLLSE